jgi:hypothetical protein
MSNANSLRRKQTIGTLLPKSFRIFMPTLCSITVLCSDSAAEEDPTSDDRQAQGANTMNLPDTFRNGPPLLVEWVIEMYHTTTDERCISKLEEIQRSEEDSTTTYLFDIDCDGNIETRYSQPDDLERAAHLAINFDGDDQMDVVLFDVTRNGYVDYSIFDVNDDGRPDLIGYHKNKKPMPFKIEFDKK